MAIRPLWAADSRNMIPRPCTNIRNGNCFRIRLLIAVSSSILTSDRNGAIYVIDTELNQISMMELNLHFQRVASGRVDVVAGDGSGGNRIGSFC